MKKIPWKKLLTAFALFLCYVVLGAVIPFIKQPGVSEETIADFNVEDFYGEEEALDLSWRRPINFHGCRMLTGLYIFISTFSIRDSP